jgi:sugar lactone lactonase YvrE
MPATHTVGEAPLGAGYGAAPMRRLAALSFLPLTMLSPSVAAQDAPILLEAGELKFQWRSFGLRPDGADPGSTHGNFAVDAAGRVIFSTDTDQALNVFSRDGAQLATWGAEFAGGTHGMCIAREGDAEVLWLAHIGQHEVVKTTLDGKVLATIGFPKEAGIYQDANEFRPTDVAVAADGSIYVADGYGKSFVHQFDAQRKYVRSFGGHGTEPGQMRTPHGITLDTRGRQPRLIVSDRENGRLQIFDLDGTLRGIVGGIFRRPCDTCLHPDGRHLAVADLAGRVTILDERNQLVAHLGDQPDAARRATNQVQKDGWQDGVFLSPHGAAFDAHGDLYVMDWNVVGRVTRLQSLDKGGK